MSKPTRTILTLWFISLCVMIVTDGASDWLSKYSREFVPFDVIGLIAQIGLISLSVILCVVAIRFILRKLFWRVGRRLALSYFLIGLLPFVLFAILMAVVGYSMAGVLSQTTLRIERLNMLSRMAQWNLEYELTGSMPPGSLETLEIYDSRDGTSKKLPQWLQTRNFSGVVKRDQELVFISAKLYEMEGEQRSLILAQPMNGEWITSLRERNGMVLLPVVAKRDEKRRRGGETDTDISLDSDADFGGFIARALGRREIVWFDIASIHLWEDGESSRERSMVTALANPPRNLLNFYFGNTNYSNVVFKVMATLAGSLMMVYTLASLLAGWLIISITRAINRIDKGTKAVERGDFSYRIRAKPTNQLGEVAQSFNRMTESIASLLGKVAEQERLQSEIDIAAAIQRNLLPRSGPENRGVSFSAHFEPTASIGGDYYDVFNIDEQRLAVAIGDVSGHGLSTGLVMAMVKAALTTLVEEGTDVTSLFIRLNDLVLRSTEKRAFMTLGFTTFDLEKKLIRHTNAGHLFPYILRRGSKPLPIEAPSLPLGVRALKSPKTVEADLEDGDTIVYFSDGIVEAVDGNGDPFGFDRLEKLLTTVIGRSAADVQAALLDAVRVYTGGRVSDDDRTVMVLRFEGIGGDAEDLERALMPLPDESIVY